MMSPLPWTVCCHGTKARRNGEATNITIATVAKRRTLRGVATPAGLAEASAGSDAPVAGRDAVAAEGGEADCGLAQPTTRAKATIAIGQTIRPEIDAQRRSMAETLH
jgi:hypothetical protein